MNRERWERAKAIFCEAADLNESKRHTYLDDACGDDKALRAEVDRLLKSDAQPTPFLRTPVPGMAMALWGQWHDASGEMVGSYRLTRLLASGGMGSVYEAIRVDGEIEQRVAIKIIRDVSANDELVRRFAQERQVLASLEHPSIARLLDAGTLPAGPPYLIMEYVEGQTIDRYCDKKKLAVKDRLRLFLQVCDAVQYAHTRLVVHRDLKPGNVLVSDEGAPKLVDFGIAKVLGRDAPTTTRGYRLMTPRYASPEQLRGEPPSTVSDVYSLGVILYELLTGQHPHQLDTRTGEKRGDYDAPITPSRVVMAGSAAGHATQGASDTTAWLSRSTTKRELINQLRGDLDTIVLAALHRDAARRYTTVENLANDIRRYLENRPVLARRDSLPYRLSKFVRRNRALAATGIVAILLLVTSVAAVAIGYVRTTRALREARDATAVAEAESIRAKQATKKAEMVSEFMMRILRASDPTFPNRSVGPDRPIRDVLLAAIDKIDTELADHPDVRGALHLQAGRALRNIGLPREAIRSFEKARAIMIDLYGRKHYKTADCLGDMSSAYLQMGEYRRAETLAQEAVLINEAYNSGAPSQSFETSLCQLGRALASAGKHAEASAVMSRAYDMCLQLCEPGRCYNSDLLGDYGNVLLSTGNFAKAEAVFTQCLDLDVQRLGADHPSVTSKMVGLANAKAQNYRYVEALELYRRIIPRVRRAMGDEHPELATVMQNTAATLLKAGGDPHEAEQMAREALTLRQKVFPAGHPRIATATVFLAVSLMEEGKFPGAEHLLREAIRTYENSLGDHPRTSVALTHLGRLLTRQGRFEEAKELLDRALAMQGLTHTDKHPVRELTLKVCTELRMALMEYDLAESLAREALTMSLDSYDEDHLAQTESYTLLGTILSRAGRLDEAETFLTKAIKIQQRELPPGHLAIGTTLVSMCELESARGNLEVAEQRCNKAIDILRIARGDDHPILAEPHTLLGCVLLEAGRLSEAESNLRHSLEIARNHFNENHPLIATTLEALARIFDLNGRQEDAQRMRREANAIRGRLFGDHVPSAVRPKNTLPDGNTR